MVEMGIDLGNSNMKIAAKLEKDQKEPILRVIKSLATTDSPDTNYVVTIEGKTVHFGVGESLIEQDKTKRKYIEHSILLAMDAVGTGAKENLKLAVGLPLKLYKARGAQYQKELNEIKHIKGRVGKNEYDITISSIQVCAEGYSAFVALNSLIDQENPSLLIDIGYRTTDIIGLKYTQGKFLIDGYTTSKIGLYNVYEGLSDLLLAKGIEMDIVDVEYRLLNAPKIELENNTIINLMDMLVEIGPIVETLVNEINQTFTDYTTRSKYLVGGGGPLMEQFIKVKKQIDADKALYGNAVGSLMQLKLGA